MLILEKQKGQPEITAVEQKEDLYWVYPVFYSWIYPKYPEGHHGGTMAG